MRRCVVDFDKGPDLSLGAIWEGSVEAGVCAEATAAGMRLDAMVGDVEGIFGVGDGTPNRLGETEIGGKAGPETSGARIKDCVYPDLACRFAISLGFCTNHLHFQISRHDIRSDNCLGNGVSRTVG